jgi:AraC-like DNA-binding protein
VALDGALDSRLPGERLECEPASVWTEPAEERHSNRVSEGGARVLALQPDMQAVPIASACAELLNAVHHWRHGGVASLARRMTAELRETDSAARLTLEGLALEMLGLGLRTRVPVGAPAALPQWLRRARDLLHDRWHDRLDLAAMAQEVGVGPARLARSFRAAFRVPLGTYQRRLRLDWAADQLVSTDTAIGRLALRAGFYDQAHFTRHFRRHTGQTPAEYRQSRR